MSTVFKRKKIIIVLMATGLCLMIIVALLGAARLNSRFTLPVDKESLAASGQYNPVGNYVTFPLKTDTNVYASLGGEVSFVGPDETAKRYKVIIDHANHLQTVYGGLDKSRVRVLAGDRVDKGSIIATITADVQNEDKLDMTIFKSWLKFDLLENGKPTNPCSALHIEG